MSPTLRIAHILAAAALVVRPVFGQSVELTYCAGFNTATTQGNSSIYQSDGLCRDFCPGHAFSIVQDKQCWCSDYAPDRSTRVDLDNCNPGCPGFPSDYCGTDKLWVYIALDEAPSGTRGPSPSTTTPPPESSDTETSTETPDDPVTSDSPPPPEPTVSIQTVTQGGAVSYVSVTVTPTAPPTSSAESSHEPTDVDTGSKGISTGAAVGIAIGVVAAVVLAVAGIFFWRRHKRNQEQAVIGDVSGSQRGGSPGNAGGTPTSVMASLWDSENTSTGRRSSRLMPHDPRMDPFTTNIYSRFENKSRESVNTLQDNHDYSRKVLRTTNPDPDPE